MHFYAIVCGACPNLYGTLSGWAVTEMNKSFCEATGSSVQTAGFGQYGMISDRFRSCASQDVHTVMCISSVLMYQRREVE